MDDKPSIDDKSIDNRPIIFTLIFALLSFIYQPLIFFVFLGIYYINRELKEPKRIRDIEDEAKFKNLQLESLDEQISKKEEELKKIEDEYEVTLDIETKKEGLKNLESLIDQKKDELVYFEDEVELQDCGLYEPKYDFMDSEECKYELQYIRDQQKQMVRDKTAAICTTEWVVGDSRQEGRKMTTQNIKHAISAFNVECQQIIAKTTPRNAQKQHEKILKVFNKINRMNEPNAIYLSEEYLDLKYQELDLSIEYELKKQEEKEAIKEAKRREKEEKSLQKDLDRQEKKIKRERRKLEEKLRAEEELARMKEQSDEEKRELEDRINALKQQLEDKDAEEESVNDRRKRTGAGFVYIISNIGSFGEDVYKIGVTRRDDPSVRVRELSNASVPFKYDVHAFIYSDEAFELETELHHKFEHKRVNKVNNHKEFFKLEPSDIEQVVKKYKQNTYSFTLKPEAEEYYETMKIEEQQKTL